MRNLARRLLSLLLVIVMLFSVTSCKKGKNMWDPNGKESGISVPGETVAEVVDEHPYFSGKEVSVYEFSEDCLWAQTYVIEFSDAIGVFLQINNSSAGDSQIRGLIISTF